MATTTVTLNSSTIPMAGGVTETVGVGKKIAVTVGGTFEAGDLFNLRLGEYNYGYVAKPTPPVSFVRTFGKKVYAITDTLLQFSAINKPKQWDTTYGIGAGFINMFNEFTGGEKLRALAAYAGRLAIFARRTIQVWSLDVDPSRNSQMQVLDNIGALAPKSVCQVGDVDVFFLADSGVRSLRSRDTNNIAFSADVGNPVDDLVTAEIRALGATAEKAIGVIEPADGRYWLAMGAKIYVFSHFASSKVAAWSTYLPGFTATDIVPTNGRLWLRGSDGKLYLYGGDNNTTFDSCTVSGKIPFLSTGSPATEKTFTAFDAVVENEWSFSIGTNPESPDTRDLIGSLWAPSFDMRRIAVNAVGTHFSVSFTTSSPGFARLSNIIIHYNAHEAG